MASHDVTLNLNTKAGPGFTAPFERLEAAARRTQGAIKLGGQAAGGNPLGAAGAMLGKLGVYGMAAAAALEAIPAAAKKATEAMNVVQNKMLTAGQKQDALAGQYGFGWLINLRDATTGVTESLRAMRGAAEIMSLKLRQVGEVESARASLQAHQHGSEYRGAALRRASVAIGKQGAALAGIDRGTYQGERQYQFAQIQFGAQVVLERAQAEAQAAGKSHEEAKRYTAGRKGALLDSRVKLGDWMNLRAKLRTGDRLRGPANAGNKESLARADIGAENATVEVLSRERLLREAISREQQLGVSAAEKKRQVEQANVGILKAQIDILRQKEMTMGTAAQTLGTMNPAQRMQALMGVKMAMKMGDIGFLPPHLRGMAQQVAPGMMAKLAERSGLRSKEFGQLQDIGAVDRGDLDAIRKERHNLETKVEVKVTIDEGALAEKIGVVLGKSLKDLVEALTARILAEVDRVKRGQHERAAGGA